MAAKRKPKAGYRLYPDSQRPGKFIVEVGSGKNRIRQRAATREEGEAKGEALVTRYRGKDINVAGTRLTLEAFVNVWWDKAIVPRKLAPMTENDYRNTLERYVLPSWGQRRLGVFDAPLIIDMYYAIAEEYSEATAHRSLTKLHMVFDAARRWKYIRDNPVADARKDLPSYQRAEKMPLTDEELTRLYAVIKGHRLELLYHTAVTLGLRLGELCGVQWVAIDWEARTITIRVQAQDLKGGVQLREKTKTVAGTRVLPLPSGLYAQLRARWDEGPKSLFIFPNDENGMLSPGGFTRHFRGGRTGRKNKNGMDKAIEGIRQKAKLGAHVTPHTFRHTCATRLKDLGVSEETRADILGHGKKSITQEYSHRALAPMRAALELMENELQKWA